MHPHVHALSAGDILRTHGFRVTAGRVKLLDHLQAAGKPRSIQDIRAALKGAPDQATLYRTLTDLAKAGIVKRVDLNTGIAHFEYTPEKPHHHHIICTGCGDVEDIEHCSVDSLQKNMTRGSRKFKSISTHSLEFFGTCASCT